MPQLNSVLVEEDFQRGLYKESASYDDEILNIKMEGM